MKFLEDTYRIVNFIENNLDKDIYLDDIIRLTELSKFHYMRIFKSITGITLNEYIRRRKLSKAASELLETTKSIIEIAFYYGYQSQEAFTRAFKEMYGLTPKVYRMNKMHFLNLDQVVFNEKTLNKKIGEDKINPIFIERRKFHIVGLRYLGNNTNREIPKLWGQFSLRFNEISNRLATNFSYGYETYAEDNKKNGILTYIAGVEVAGKGTVPKGMVSIEVPANNYAAFPIPAIIEDAPKTIKRIYSKLLFDLRLEPCDNYDFELYDETFVPNDNNSKYYLCIPIK